MNSSIMSLDLLLESSLCLMSLRNLSCYWARSPHRWVDWHLLRGDISLWEFVLNWCNVILSWIRKRPHDSCVSRRAQRKLLWNMQSILKNRTSIRFWGVIYDSWCLSCILVLLPFRIASIVSSFPNVLQFPLIISWI